jgi:thiol-disulfide isomerase/thioredoxin
MKSIITIIVFLIISSCTIKSYAQSELLHPVHIGEKVPDIALDHMINSAGNIKKLSDYKSRLIILDFWATWCHWCIAAFPNADSLQHKFGDKMQFLLVNSIENNDDEKKVKEFYKKRLATDKDFKLPSVYLEPVLSKMFPHRLLPYEVWIKDGVVIALTDQDDITEENIQLVLTDKAGNFNRNKNF